MLRHAASLLSVCILASAGLPAAAQQPDQSPGPTGQTTHVINVALVIAGGEGGGGLEPLPSPVAKAIHDLKDFLPYARYEMHDSVVVRTAAATSTHFDLQGPNSRYKAEMLYRMRPDPGRLSFDKFVLARAIPRTRPGASGDDPVATADPAYTEVITTAFSVKIGEPIVVGTSRLDGTGKALVVILTVQPTP